MKPIEVECVKCRLPIEVMLTEDIPAIFSEHSWHGELECPNCEMVNSLNITGCKKEEEDGVICER